MDQLKIGRFIAKRRKAVGLTQFELAEKLGITDKAVSKWERGKAMPDVAIMQELCGILKITVNDLLCGEVVTMDNENKNEQLLLNMAKELEHKNKTIWQSMWVIMIVSLTALFAGILIARFLISEEIWQVVTILGVGIAFLIPLPKVLRGVPCQVLR